MRATEVLRERLRWLSKNRKDVLLAAIYITFTVIGAVIAVSASASGNRSEMLLGVASVLFFGLGGLGYFGIKYAHIGARRHVDSAEVYTIQHHGRSHRGLAVPGVSRGKLLLASLVFAGWTVAAVIFGGISASGGVRLVLFATAVLSGVMALVGFVGMVGRTDTVLLTDGVLGRSPFGSSFVPWDAIADVHASMYGSQPMLGVNVTDHDSVKQPG